MRQHTHLRTASISAAAAAAAIGLTFAGSTLAYAHASIDASTNEAGAYATLTFAIPHGCDESPTTKVVIDIPDEILTVTPTRSAFYTLEKHTEKLAQPVDDGHGNEIAERVSEVAYTATTPLPADQRDILELVVKLPEDAAGKTLYFPVKQTCEQGEITWGDIAAEGQDPHDLPHPAPGLEVVAGSGHGHGHGHDHGTEASDEHSHGHDQGDDAADASDASKHEAAAADSDGNSAMPVAVTGLVVGALGLVVGAASLLRGRRKA